MGWTMQFPAFKTGWFKFCGRCHYPVPQEEPEEWYANNFLFPTDKPVKYLHGEYKWN